MSDLAALLSEGPWLTRLARSLASDAAEAADAVQETWLAAMRSPPDPDRPVRPWLRRVLVNTLRMRHRSRGRRAANEAVTESLVEPAQAPDQLLERARLERRLADLVLALEEPFRTTVLLRYREGISAEAIAKQQGIPAGTVRSRLKTALDRLRRELDGESPARWRAVFAPLVAVPHPSSGSLWRIVMAKATTKPAVTVVILLLLLLGVLALQWRDRTSSRDDAAVTARPLRGATPRVEPRVIAPGPAVFAQPGLAARQVSGRVTFGGRPFAGAVVRLAHAETQVQVAEAVSGEGGGFDLGSHPATSYVVTATAPDKAPATAAVDLRSPSELALELRLSACSQLRGTVQDGSGAPIARARISRADVPWPSAETDSQGRYELCLQFGFADVSYSAIGYAGVVLGLDIDETTKRDVVLVPEATVAGTVVREDGTPVAEAWITIDPSDKGRERNAPAHGRSDADGRFRIAQVAPGRNRISAFTATQIIARKLEVVITAGQVLEDVVVRIETAARVTGTVVAAGAPVVGAGVGIRVGNRDERGVIAVTQLDGRFAIERVPRTEVALYVEDHTVVTPRSVRVDGAGTDVRVEVERLGTVRGRVVHAGKPIPEAMVYCAKQGATEYVYSDGHGAFACTGVAEGPRELAAFAPDGRWGKQVVTVVRGGAHQLEIELVHGAAICGFVVDERAQPMAGLEVRIVEPKLGDHGSDRTGADGRFCARFLSGRGEYQISVFDGGQRLEPLAPIAPLVIPDSDGRPEIRIAVATPRLAIAGTVTDSTGAPVADAVIRVAAANRIGSRMFDPRAPSSTAITGARGEFELARLASGDYTVLASGRDGSEAVVTPVRAGTRNLAIVLDPAGRIEGRLAGFTSEPVITGIILGTSRFSNNPLDAQVDGDRFQASGLSPGTYVLTAVTGGGEGDTQEVIVRPGQTSTVTMTSRGTASALGKVLDHRTRAPIAGLRCNAATRTGDKIGAIYSGPDSYVISDAKGAFRIERVPAGEIVVVCGGNARSSGGLRMVTAPRDQTITVEVFTIPRTGEAGTIDARFEFLRTRIEQLTVGGMAERAGLRVGDEVIAVDGASVAELDARTTMLLITQRRAGSTATLAIRRGGETRQVAVTIRADDL